MEKELTRFELKLMNILWDKKKAFVNDILEQIPGPTKPAYSTISTMMRILVQKGYACYESFGKSHRYYPIVERSEYSKTHLRNTRDTLFGGSYSAMISFFAEAEELSPEAIEELITILNEAK